MGFPVYDSRTDSGSVVITPEIRACFVRMEPGQSSGGHTHDLGHELFLVLEGRADFEIDGDTRALGPGQMCVAMADQMHFITVVGDEPMTMYYSVTPHVQPTHTQWSEGRHRGDRLAHGFVPSDRDVTRLPDDELVDAHVEAVQALANAAQAAAKRHRENAADLKNALGAADRDAATEAKASMWEALLPVYTDLFALTTFWNDASTR